MTLVRLDYLHSFVDRHGRPRYYFRRRGRRWPLPAPGSPGFTAAYEALLISTEKRGPRNGGISFLPGTLGWAIEKFTGRPEYLKERAAGTRKADRRIFDELRRRFGAGMLRDLTTKHVKLIRNAIMESHTTSTADVAIGLISVVWEYAEEFLDVDGLDANPTIGVKRVHKVGRGAQPWPLELIEACDRLLPPSLAFAKRLLLYTGQRGSDVVRMEWKHFDGEYILVRQKKTENQIDQLLSIPCHEVLRAELMSMPRRGRYILLGERGDRLQAKSLSIMLSRALALIGGKGYSMHGLRKNAAKALAEAGCSDAQIMAITGHRTNEMIRLYTKGAEQKRLARSAMDQLQAKSS